MNSAKSVASLEGRATLLVVEDEVLIRLMLADHLRDEGFRVIEAKNGEEALSILHSTEKIDLIMTDIRMPGDVDGVTLAQLAKGYYGIPVILMSGHYNALLAKGVADVFLAKPYDLDQVIAAVTELIDDAGNE